MVRAPRPDQLPVWGASERIVGAMADGGALVLAAATGSGKTTQVPQMLLKSGTVDGQIVVLEPRRLAARLTARRVAAELGCELGAEVGFQTRFERAVSARTRVRFVTEGVLLRQALRDPLLGGVGAVLLDEFHERSLLADLALGLVRQARAARVTGAAGGHRAAGAARSPLAVAAMSATMETGAVAAYLGAPVVQAEGRAYPVAVRYEPGDERAPVWERAAAAVRAVLAEQGDGDVLVFMPGGYEIDRTIEAVRAAVRGPEGRSMDVVGLHGTMSAALQDAAVAPAAPGRRKVIVATNVAETSITLPGVVAVVDAGLARVFRADPRRGLNMLRTEPISRASADQRAGRAGRTAPGVCVRLWTERDHALRAASEVPEVRRVELAEAMLMVEAMDIPGAPKCGRFAAFPWLDAPEPAAVERASAALRLVGALDDRGALTAMGRALAEVPAHPRLARALLEARRLGVLERAARWCAIAAEREVVQQGSPAQLVRLTPDGEPPSDLAVREELVRRVEESGFRSARHEGVEANLGACREVSRAARELMSAAEGAGGRDGGAGRATGAERAADARHRDGAGGEVGAGRGGGASTEGGSFARVSQAMLAGFADHVAWRMDAQRPHCAMAGRRKVAVDRDSVQRGAGFVLALEVREAGRGEQVHQSLGLVSPLERAWIESALPGRLTQRVETRYSDELGAAAEFEEAVFDGVVVDQVVRPLRGRSARAAAHEELAARVASGELRPRSWDEAVDQWIARVRCVAEWMPERGLIRYDEDDLGVLAAEIAQGCARASDLDDRPVLDILRNALSWDEQQVVEKAAPAQIALPSGHRMRLQYEPGKPPVGRAKIQDFYDFEGHPCVAGGRVKVRLELLGPNFRPVQITDDLPGFWVRLYPEVKKELKRRYPRHEWR